MTVTEPVLRLAEGALAPSPAVAFLAAMGGPRVEASESILIEAADRNGVLAHRRLRTAVFVETQGLFVGHDRDDIDEDPDTIVLVARRSADGAVLGGVRVHHHAGHGGIGWWRGSRLVVAPDAGAGVGSQLVVAAMALAEDRGALRFDATVQRDKRRFFERLGWRSIGTVPVVGVEHELMLAPVDRFERLLGEYKAPIGRLVGSIAPGGRGFVGDDAAPVPGSDLVAACDAIVPAMVERDPEWAGWASVLVNLNDLAAMGAEPVGLLDAVAGRSEHHVATVLRGIAAASAAYGVPILGGHTQLGDRASLAVTALGRTPDPVPGGGGRPGDWLRLVADLGGGWRPGYVGRQWDSTTHRTPDQLRHLIGTLGRNRPAAAKDVSMGGMIGTLAMLAEASDTGAEVDMAAVPRPEAAAMTDWLTCFPGFALLTADRPGTPVPTDVAPATVCTIGRLTAEVGEVTLRWPDGRVTSAVRGGATGLGPATSAGAPLAFGGGVVTLTIAAVAAPFDRDLDRGLAAIGVLLDRARASGAGLVVLPEAALGGYLTDLSGGTPDAVPDLPPPLEVDGPVLARVAAMAGDLVVCVGFCESDGRRRFNSAACVHDGQVLGSHRKVHLPLREDASYDAGDTFAAFATPVGRLGMMICYDKAFPESGRALALDGAEVITCLSAWPSSRTAPAATLAEDRWTHRFDLYDQAGALQNQVVWASANQSGTFGDLRFVGSAKVVGPGGEVLATTGVEAGMAVATVDLDADLVAARRGMGHLRDRRPDLYGALVREQGALVEAAP